MNIKFFQKTKIQLLLSFQFFCILGIQSTLGQEINYAFLIGVSEYEENTGWSSLSGVNDINLLSHTLLKLGYKSEHIIRLENDDFTKETLANTFQDNIISKVNPGDNVHFHFSGHGQQVIDKNGDEVDNLDEAFVPFNSPKVYKKDIYEGELLVTDDQIASLLKELRTKLGSQGHVFFTVDACHSGTSTRGRSVSRGSDLIMGPEASEKTKSLRSSSMLQDEEMAEENIASLTSMFSSSQHQLSYEKHFEGYGNVGVFTFTLAKQLLQSSESTNYADLFNRIKTEMASHNLTQSPSIDGEVQKLLFQNSTKTSSSYTILEKFDNNLIQVNAGKIHGLDLGTKVKLFSDGSLQDTCVCFGIIDYVGVFDSDVKLNCNLDDHDISDLRVEVDNQNVSPSASKIKIDFNTGDLDFSGLKGNIAFTEVDTDATYFLEQAQGLTSSNEFVLYDVNDQIIWRDEVLNKADSLALLSLSKTIEQHNRAQFLRALENQSPGYDLDISFHIEKGDSTQVSPMNNFMIGDRVKLVVTNSGEKPCYFSILDIQPDHTINKLIPYDLSSQDYYLSSQDSYETPFFKVEEPVGLDMFKLFATSQPLEFNSLRSEHAPNSDLSNLLQTLLNPNTQLRGSQTLKPTQGYIGSLVIEISAPEE